MRIRNTLKNSAYAIVSYCVLAVLALLVRKVFVSSLPIALLGYEGLFGNVFSLIALADLGLETVILYRLFPAFAEDNKKEICTMMTVYKKLYAVIGFAILVIGIVLAPFIKYIIKDNNLDWRYVYVIYFVQMSVTLCTYFLAYKRLVFTVSQQEYECTKVDTVIQLGFNIVKIVVLIVFKSYICYLLCNLATNLLSNIIISIKVKEAFPYVTDAEKVSFDVIRDLGLSKEIKNNIVQKICGTIYGGTDNIITSALLGISYVGLLSNYSSIQGYISTFTTKMLKPFQVSIGNYIYSADSESGYKMFRMFDLISFFIACVISSCYLCAFNPFITIWLGEQYTLSVLFVIAFAVNQYILWNHQFLTFYRGAFGGYELDKLPIAFAAVANLFFSIVLCKPFGMAGIMIGTAIGQIGFWLGRVRVVYTEYIKENLLKYVERQIIRLAIWGSEMAAVYFLGGFLPISLLGIVLRVLLGIGFPTLVNFVVFFKSSEMESIITYTGRVLEIL